MLVEVERTAKRGECPLRAVVALADPAACADRRGGQGVGEVEAVSPDKAAPEFRQDTAEMNGATRWRGSPVSRNLPFNELTQNSGLSRTMQDQAASVAARLALAVWLPGVV